MHTLGQQVNFRTKSTLFNLYEDRYLQVLIIIHIKFTHAYGQKKRELFEVVEKLSQKLLTGKHFIHKHPIRPPVGSCRMPLSVDDLWRHVFDRTTEGIGFLVV